MPPSGFRLRSFLAIPAFPLCQTGIDADLPPRPGPSPSGRAPRKARPADRGLPLRPGASRTATRPGPCQQRFGREEPFPAGNPPDCDASGPPGEPHCDQPSKKRLVGERQPGAIFPAFRKPLLRRRNPGVFRRPSDRRRRHVVSGSRATASPPNCCRDPMESAPCGALSLAFCRFVLENDGSTWESTEATSLAPSPSRHSAAIRRTSHATAH